jgi:hypothetical protein
VTVRELLLESTARISRRHPRPPRDCSRVTFLLVVVAPSDAKAKVAFAVAMVRDHTDLVGRDVAGFDKEA